MESNSRAPLLKDSIALHVTESESIGGMEHRMEKSIAKSIDKSYEISVSKQYHKMVSYDPYTNANKKSDQLKACKCDASLIICVLLLIFGIIIILFATLINTNTISTVVNINTSYLLLLISFGVSLIFGSFWSMLQYYPLNLQCIKQTYPSNVFCMILGFSFMILAIIGLLDEFSDVYSEYDTIKYPWYLSFTLLIISILCFIYLSCINTHSAQLAKEKRIYLQNYYYDKMISDEGEKNDYKQNEQKLPTYIKKNGTMHPYDRSIFSLIWHTFT
eukprot:498075_1